MLKKLRRYDRQQKLLFFLSLQRSKAKSQVKKMPKRLGCFFCRRQNHLKPRCSQDMKILSEITYSTTQNTTTTSIVKRKKRTQIPERPYKLTYLNDLQTSPNHQKVFQEYHHRCLRPQKDQPRDRQCYLQKMQSKIN